MHWNSTTSPQKKSSEILNRLIALARSHQVVDNFTLRKAKQEAESLVQNDAAAAHLVLGVIACLEGNVPELHRRHRLAINLAADRSHAIAQYAISLSRLSLFDEAVPLMESVIELEPENRSALALLIMICYRAGRLRSAERWLAVWQQRCPNLQHEQESLIKQSLEFARQHEITDDDLATSIKEAVKLVVARSTPQGHWEGGLSSDDDNQWITYRLNLAADPAVVAGLSQALADRFADLELNPHSSTRFAVGYGIELQDVVHGGNA